MVNSNEIYPVQLNLDDVDDALKLSIEAGWNQIDKDWQLFISKGKAIGFRNSSGQLVASAATLPYQNNFGFISMVLVTKNWRRQGLATQLVNNCIELLKSQQLIPVLDATIEGAKVYRHQGFLPLFDLNRWQLIPELSKPDTNSADLSTPEFDIEKLQKLDAGAVGASRSHILDDFCSRSGTRIEVLDDESGFGLMRSGRNAAQIGPVIAPTQSAAISLLERLMSHTSGPIYIDVPTMADQVGQWLKNRGFTIQRGFIRMAQGRAKPFGNPAHLLASAGPEFG
ncbi:MAG: GNAT family N-acetyltransferase [Devosiaceae bacterium]|nr:GNAT family N-acetyltransferase [Devosiaceae bacterium]